MASHCDRCTRRDLKKLRRQLERMENLIMTTKEETLAALAELKDDVQRLVRDLAAKVEELRVAIEAGNMDDIKAATDEINAIVEAASPEPTEPPVEPTP